ncbi:MAG: phosphatase PAP2 family protein [Rufibacter sp.]
MRHHFHQNRFAVLLALGVWLFMVTLVWTLPIAFSGYLHKDADTVFWYFVSESGGVYGTTVLAVILCWFVASQQKGVRNRARSFTAAFGFLLVALGGIGLLNEYVVKPITRVPRPSHQYLLGSAGQEPSLLEAFYGKEVAARQAFLLEYLKTHPEKSALISPYVLSHWVEEAGYSFPSGHSQNAFLLGSMLTLWLGMQLPRHRRPWLAVPLVWAVLVCLSRVALGVHSELDVTLGAGLGLVLAYLFSVSGLLNKVFRVATEPERIR